MAETAVEGFNGGLEFLLEDIDQRKIGPGTERIVVRLGRNTAADRLGIASVAAAGALDAQFERRQHSDRTIDFGSKARLEEDGALKDHILRRLPFGPGGEGFMRLNVGTPVKVLEKAMTRLEEAVRARL